MFGRKLILVPALSRVGASFVPVSVPDSVTVKYDERVVVTTLLGSATLFGLLEWVGYDIGKSLILEELSAIRLSFLRRSLP